MKNYRRLPKRPKNVGMLEGLANTFGRMPTEAAITLAIIGGGATILIASAAIAQVKK